ncbi:MAG: hypothetical protein HQL13_06600 [Candidatus Omnitrophica bacterium]|nr:hypothetical protein [Candidatus Omnitrophota bacterium]
MKYVRPCLGVLLVVVFQLACVSTTTFAQTSKTFKKGVSEVFTSPLQVTENVKTETAKAKFVPFGLVGGLIKGGFYMAKKIVIGTLDVAKSPLDMFNQN